HRTGGAGRAGRSGRAISFVAGRELFQIHQIERYTRVKMHQGKPPTAAEVEEARSDVLLARLRATLQGGEFKRQDHLVERLLEEGFNSTDIASALFHQLQSGSHRPANPRAAKITNAPCGRRMNDTDATAMGPTVTVVGRIVVGQIAATSGAR